jgi:hypothetical protein
MIRNEPDIKAAPEPLAIPESNSSLQKDARLRVKHK